MGTDTKCAKRSANLSATPVLPVEVTEVTTAATTHRHRHRHPSVILLLTATDTTAVPSRRHQSSHHQSSHHHRNTHLSFLTHQRSLVTQAPQATTLVTQDTQVVTTQNLTQNPQPLTLNIRQSLEVFPFVAPFSFLGNAIAPTSGVV